MGTRKIPQENVMNMVRYKIWVGRRRVSGARRVSTVESNGNPSVLDVSSDEYSECGSSHRDLVPCPHLKYPTLEEPSVSHIF